MTAKRTLRTYDHRFIRLVQETGDATIATSVGIPRSTRVSSATCYASSAENARTP